MARVSPLKVFRTPMGFFDAVVAAPSQTAALKAWGVTSNLFAENLAEEVKDDPALLAEASKAPGEVLRKPRGDPETILAAASPPRRRKVEPTKKPIVRERAAPRVEPSPSKPAKPKDRGKLDSAKAALAQVKGKRCSQAT